MLLALQPLLEFPFPHTPDFQLIHWSQWPSVKDLDPSLNSSTAATRSQAPHFLLSEWASLPCWLLCAWSPLTSPSHSSKGAPLQVKVGQVFLAPNFSSAPITAQIWTDLRFYLSGTCSLCLLSILLAALQTCYTCVPLICP